MLRTGGVPTTCTAWRKDCDCNGSRILGGPELRPRIPGGTRTRPPLSWERDALGTWTHGTSWSQRKISVERHQAFPCASQHFTEGQPREEDGCFNASISVGLRWPELGRKGAFAPFAFAFWCFCCFLGPSRRCRQQKVARAGAALLGLQAR